MKVLDVNVVVAGHRDDHERFQATRAWLEGLWAREEDFAVTDLVAGSFIRIVTSRRVFTEPTSLADAFAYLRAVRAQTRHVRLTPGPRHLEILERLCRESNAAGDLVPDALLAAIAVEHGAEVVSFDHDFARFGDLRWSLPTG